MWTKPSRMRRTTWCAVVGYVLVASGLPLPGGGWPAGDAVVKQISGKDRSRPFPCMDKPCGCATAEQCFTNCCCHTPAELLAWARAKRVDRAVIVALSRRAAASDGTTSPPKPVANCCSTVARPACCAEADRPACLGATPPVPAETEAAPVSVRAVVLRALLACGGIATEWLSVGGGLPPPPVTACDRGGPPAAALTLFDESSLSERVAPEGPPPRVS